MKESEVKKLEIREDEKDGLSYEYKLGFNLAIDLCNAKWIRRLDKEELITLILNNCCYLTQGNAGFDVEKLAQAIITHLTKKEDWL